MYASDDEHRAGLTAYLTDGLARHERVLYLGASAWLWWRRYT
jgi:hypothetical protein